MPSPDSPSLYRFVQSEVFEVLSLWGNYRQIFGHSKERIDMLNECAPQRFGQIQEALLQTVQLRLVRIADGARRGKFENATLHRLVEELGKDSSLLTSGDIAKVRDSIDRYKRLCDRMRTLRNKPIGHLDHDENVGKQSLPLARKSPMHSKGFVHACAK